MLCAIDIEKGERHVEVQITRDKLESLSLGCPQHEAMYGLAIGSVFVVAFKVKPFERNSVFFLSHFVTEVMKLAF